MYGFNAANRLKSRVAAMQFNNPLDRGVVTFYDVSHVTSIQSLPSVRGGDFSVLAYHGY